MWYEEDLVGHAFYLRRPLSVRVGFVPVRSQSVITCRVHAERVMLGGLGRTDLPLLYTTGRHKPKVCFFRRSDHDDRCVSCRASV